MTCGLLAYNISLKKQLHLFLGEWIAFIRWRIAYSHPLGIELHGFQDQRINSVRRCNCLLSRTCRDRFWVWVLFVIVYACIHGTLDTGLQNAGPNKWSQFFENPAVTITKQYLLKRNNLLCSRNRASDLLKWVL